MNSSLFNALDWLAAILMGPAATGLAVIAVGLLGLGTLSGHFDKRRALRVLLGLLLLFAAPTIVAGFQDLIVDGGSLSSARSDDEAKARPQAICWTCG